MQSTAVVENSFSPDVLLSHLDNTFNKPPNSLEHSLAAIAPRILFQTPSRQSRMFPTVPLQVTTITKPPQEFSLPALLDSGATGLYISRDFVKEHAIPTRPLPSPLYVYNADDTLNKNGTVTHEVELSFTIQGHTSRSWFYVTDIGTKPLIVGMTWLREHNPLIDWRTGKLHFQRCPGSCGGRAQTLHNFHELLEPPSSTIAEDGSINLMTHHINVKEGHSTRMAIEDLKGKKVLTIEDIRNGPFAEYIDVFEEEGFQELPPHRPWDHEIDLIPEWEKKKWKPRIYPLTYDEQQELDKFLKENLDSGRIRPSKSPLASPVFFISKKDGKKRMVIDYRRLNDITVPNVYPLPLAEELTNKWKGAVYFSALDVRAGYYNIRMAEGDEWKTAFITNRGLFESLVMTFGLNNAPATFQTMMNDVFVVYIRRGDTEAFMDDVAIGTRPDPTGQLSDEEYHIKCVKEILKVFRENHLFLKAEKCIFLQRSIKYLGFIISGENISMDPVKVEGVRDWPIPTKLKELRSFLGFCNFYRRFIRDYSQIARPLNDLTKNDTPFTWDEPQQAAFKKLKDAILSEQVLVHPDIEKPYLVETDASNYAYGAVLSQQQDDGKWHPVAFISHSMTKEERNYDVHDKELLSIVRALEEWRHYLMGTKHEVEVLTDHNNLLYFRKSQNLNRRQARWAQYLEHFHLILRHRPGKLNTIPDALSRRADYDDGKEDNKQVTILPNKLFKETVNAVSHFSFTDELFREQAKDPLLLGFNTTSESDPLPAHWEIREGLWTYWGKIYVPSSLRQTLFRMLHSSPASGHPGRDATLELIRRDYYWPALRSDVESWVRNCDVCQHVKIARHKSVGQLKPIDTLPRFWGVVTTDLITGLPMCQGFDSIWAITDKRGKMIHIAPTTKTVDSEGVYRIYMDRVWKLHGTPDKIISDRGPQFASRFAKNMNEQLQIETALSTAYHPQTDGQSERTNQEIEQVLRTVVNFHQDDWVDWLPIMEFALNNRYKKSLKTTPFYANYGFHPHIGSLPKIDTPITSVENFVKHIQSVQKDTEASLEQAAKDMKRFYDRHRGKTPEYEIGQKVLLDNADLALNRPSRKLAERRSGPFEITDKIGTHAYRLKLPLQWKNVHPVFHVSKLEPYHEDPESPNFPSPPPDIIEGEPEWEVEEIKDSKFTNNRLFYLVKWLNWPDSENSWEPDENLIHSKDAIGDFHKTHPNAPRRLPSGVRVGKPSKRASRKVKRKTRVNEITFVPLYPQTDVSRWPKGLMSRDATF